MKILPCETVKTTSSLKAYASVAATRAQIKDSEREKKRESEKEREGDEDFGKEPLTQSHVTCEGKMDNTCQMIAWALHIKFYYV